MKKEEQKQHLIDMMKGDEELGLYKINITPEEKAKYLISINSLAILSVIGNKLLMIEIKEIAKQSALIAVDFARDNPLNKNGYNKYLDKVKKEIENYEFR